MLPNVVMQVGQVSYPASQFSLIVIVVLSLLLAFLAVIGSFVIGIYLVFGEKMAGATLSAGLSGRPHAVGLRGNGRKMLLHDREGS
jgi:hypothetical protein